jgi:MFS transporter, AAHS family, benzoate transport protein
MILDTKCRCLVAGFSTQADIAAIGMSGLMPNCISLMTEYSPKKRRPLLIEAIYIGYALGGILASLIGMYLIPYTDWRVLYFIGAIPLLTIPLFIKQFPESLSYYLAKKQVGKVVEEDVKKKTLVISETL